ncbi:hypothetical protein CAMRE0001_2893 [Campylobacter rectus RM3267]|uniref:Uncharacterized protein n=1 Tax=Campylobacter rectus RM3267 TaxID=553218 RepID=B9D258_CAMRE|nr:hypothetical protein CAMRE0001_2893 [Campylobacter rectus RM3267]
MMHTRAKIRLSNFRRHYSLADESFLNFTLLSALYAEFTVVAI